MIYRRLLRRTGQLSAADAFAADVIYLLEQPTLTQFAGEMGISQPSASYRVNELAQKGVVEKVTSPRDRRECRLRVERLLAILSKATQLTDVLELESRLSDVRYQIESYEATLRNLDSRISYSTLHITLQEVVEYSIINSPPQTLGQRLSDGFKDSMRMVKNSAESVLVWLVTFVEAFQACFRFFFKKHFVGRVVQHFGCTGNTVLAKI